jgi:uncharacterized protein (DUF302 family)
MTWNSRLSTGFCAPDQESFFWNQVLDLAFAPGVSPWEPGGMSVREAIAHLHAVAGTIVAADIVEYHPLRESSGITAMVAAKIVEDTERAHEKNDRSQIIAEQRVLNRQEESSMPAQGMVEVSSPHTVDQTLQRLRAVLAAHGLQLFALVDHSGEAAKVGLKMPPTKLLIFGSPKAGTPLMIAAPSLAIDLPLKALVWEDQKGKVWVSYNSPEYLQKRHRVPDDLVKNIAGAGALIAKAVE